MGENGHIAPGGYRRFRLFSPSRVNFRRGPVDEARGMWNEEKSARQVLPTPVGGGFEIVTPLKHKISGHTFKADLDVAELDDRQRPGPAWAARAMTLSRSHLVLLSRRMSYIGRVLLVAVHMIDARPTPLMGRVVECEYHADGLYRIALELMPLPDAETLAAWYPNGSLK